MIELHSCSYFCQRPDCIKTQRDEMRDNLACDAVAWCYIHEGECEEIGWGLPPDAIENEATLLYAAPQSALEQPAEMVLVPREPDTTHMENYQAGLWSRRNLEALLEDVAAAQKEGE